MCNATLLTERAGDAVRTCLPCNRRQTLYWSREIVQDKGCIEQVELEPCRPALALLRIPIAVVRALIDNERHGFFHMLCKFDSKQKEHSGTEDHPRAW